MVARPISFIIPTLYGLTSASKNSMSDAYTKQLSSIDCLMTDKYKAANKAYKDMFDDFINMLDKKHKYKYAILNLSDTIELTSYNSKSRDNKVLLKEAAIIYKEHCVDTIDAITNNDSVLKKCSILLEDNKMYCSKPRLFLQFMEQVWLHGICVNNTDVTNIVSTVYNMLGLLCNTIDYSMLQEALSNSLFIIAKPSNSTLPYNLYAVMKVSYIVKILNAISSSNVFHGNTREKRFRVVKDLLATVLCSINDDKQVTASNILSVAGNVVFDSMNSTNSNSSSSSSSCCCCCCTANVSEYVAV